MELMASFNDSLLNTGFTEKIKQAIRDQNSSVIRSPKQDTQNSMSHKRSKTLLLTSQRSSKNLNLPLLYGSNNMGNSHLFPKYRESNIQTDEIFEEGTTLTNRTQDKKSPTSTHISPNNLYTQKKNIISIVQDLNSRTSLGTGSPFTSTLEKYQQKRATALNLASRNLFPLSPETNNILQANKTEEGKESQHPLKIASVGSPQDMEALTASNQTVNTFASKHYRLKQVP